MLLSVHHDFIMGQPGANSGSWAHSASWATNHIWFWNLFVNHEKQRFFTFRLAVDFPSSTSHLALHCVPETSSFCSCHPMNFWCFCSKLRPSRFKHSNFYSLRLRHSRSSFPTVIPRLFLAQFYFLLQTLFDWIHIEFWLRHWDPERLFHADLHCGLRLLSALESSNRHNLHLLWSVAIFPLQWLLACSLWVLWYLHPVFAHSGETLLAVCLFYLLFYCSQSSTSR